MKELKQGGHGIFESESARMDGPVGGGLNLPTAHGTITEKEARVHILFVGTGFPSSSVSLHERKKTRRVVGVGGRGWLDSITTPAKKRVPIPVHFLYGPAIQGFLRIYLTKTLGPLAFLF